MEKNNHPSSAEESKAINSYKKEISKRNHYYSDTINYLFLAPRNEKIHETGNHKCSSVNGFGDGPKKKTVEIKQVEGPNAPVKGQHESIVTVNGRNNEEEKFDKKIGNPKREKLLEWLKISQAKRDENNQQMFQRWMTNSETEFSTALKSVTMEDVTNFMANVQWMNQHLSTNPNGIDYPTPLYSFGQPNLAFQLQSRFLSPSTDYFKPITLASPPKRHESFETYCPATDNSFKMLSSNNDNKILAPNYLTEIKEHYERQLKNTLNSSMYSHVGIFSPKFSSYTEAMPYPQFLHDACLEKYTAPPETSSCPQYITLQDRKQNVSSLPFISDKIYGCEDANAQIYPLFLQNDNAYEMLCHNFFASRGSGEEYFNTPNNLTYPINSPYFDLPQNFSYSGNNGSIYNTCTNMFGGVDILQEKLNESLQTILNIQNTAVCEDTSMSIIPES